MLVTDASSNFVGPVLWQEQNSALKLISFFSIKLNNTQQKYSTFSRGATRNLFSTFARVPKLQYFHIP